MLLPRRMDTDDATLNWVLGSCPLPPTRSLEVVFLGDSRWAASLSVAAYHHAVDSREVTVLHRCGSPRGHVTLATIGGRHVGSLRNLVASGHRFSTFVHAVVSARRLCIYSALPQALLETGMAPLSEPQVTGNSRRRLRELEVFDTRWARAWSLSPRVARVALLLMRGLRPAQIGSQLGLGEKTVNGYTEVLFERAGVCSRGALAPAALEASGYASKRNPEGVTGGTTGTHGDYGATRP